MVLIYLSYCPDSCSHLAAFTIVAMMQRDFINSSLKGEKAASENSHLESVFVHTEDSAGKKKL